MRLPILVSLPPDVINWNITDIGEGNRIDDGNNLEALEEEVYSELIPKVDELVVRFNLR